MSCIQIKMAHDAYSTTPKFRGFLHATTSIVRDEGEGCRSTRHRGVALLTDDT